MTSLQKLIKKGKYDFANSNITDKNFPDFDKMPNEKTELVHLGKSMSSEDVLRELKNKGLRPANLRELLEFGKANPEEHRKYRIVIVALGSIWRGWGGHQYVPSLWGRADERRLFLDWFEDDWSEGYRFAAVRESNPSEHSCEYKDKLEKLKEFMK